MVQLLALAISALTKLDVEDPTYDSTVHTIAPGLLTQGRSSFADNVSTGRASRTLVVTALGSKRVLVGPKQAEVPT